MIEKITNTVEHLVLIFCEDGHTHDPSLGEEYAKLFTEAECFKKVNRLELELNGQSNFSYIFDAINAKDDKFEMFRTVKHIHFAGVNSY
jgi:hypothetical protein